MKLENGALDISVMKNPHDGWNLPAGDHFTGMQLTLNEWIHLYHGVLGVPETFHPVNLVEDFDTFQEGAFRDFMGEKGYKMLGRIWDIYQDTHFLYTEVEELKNECIELQRFITDEFALSALHKISRAAEEAITLKSGLAFLSD